MKLINKTNIIQRLTCVLLKIILLKIHNEKMLKKTVY
jgi:hypothetical protein